MVKGRTLFSQALLEMLRRQHEETQFCFEELYLEYNFKDSFLLLPDLIELLRERKKVICEKFCLRTLLVYKYMLKNLQIPSPVLESTLN